MSFPLFSLSRARPRAVVCSALCLGAISLNVSAANEPARKELVRKEQAKKDAGKGDAAQANLPKRDFTVELRQVEEGASQGYTVGTQHSGGNWPAQAIRVRNGEKASLRMGQAMPVQWVQSVSVQTSGVSAGGMNASTMGAGVNQATAWLQAGQAIEVTPRWRGGTEDVALEVEVQTNTIGDQAASSLPRQGQNQVSTTVSAPLGLWVILASSGGTPAAKGSYGSEPGNEVRKTLQVRVSAP